MGKFCSILHLLISHVSVSDTATYEHVANVDHVYDSYYAPYIIATYMAIIYI